MPRTFDSTARGDKPRDHVAARGSGGSHPHDDERVGVRATSNPQSRAPGWTDSRRRRYDWLRNVIGSPAGIGGDVDPADINALPEAHRAKARQIVAETRRLFEQGDQDRAREHVRSELAGLEGEIGHAWEPPSEERPDDALLDQIQGARYTS